jgi:hypothetical protein
LLDAHGWEARCAPFFLVSPTHICVGFIDTYNLKNMADLVARLKVDSKEYDSKIERARSGLLHLEQSLHDAGKTFADADKNQVAFTRSLGNMQTVSRTARGRLSELTKAYTDLRLQYKSLTDAEKQSPFGRALSGSLDQLRGRIETTRRELSDISGELGGGSKLGQFGDILDTIGQKMGATGNLTDMLTSKTALLTGAIGASVTAVAAATKEWAAYNNEIAKQDQITQVTTGLQGGGAERMTDAARSISSVYGTDFREVINAANTLMTQFGESGDDAIQLIRDGMQGMLQGDGAKLLTMIQQFAPSFRDAGISASQLVAIIHNSEGGIFTDQNMNAIVMGIKNIRLMTNATSEALAKLGIDGKKMSEQLNDGSLTIFQALRQVSDAVTNVGTGSQTAGEVMQQVFGRQGAAAGTNLGKAIATLNTNLEETRTQTGELGKSYADLEAANERLNRAIRDCFEYDGWKTMTIGLKTGLVTALAAVAEKLGDIKEFVTGIEVAGTNVFDAIRTSAINSLGPLGKVLNLLIDINKAKGGIGSGGDAGAALGAAIGTPAAAGGQSPAPAVVTPKNRGGVGTTKTEPTVTGGLKGLKELDGEALHVTESMKGLREQLSNYRKTAENADNPMDYARAQQGIADTQAKIKVQPMALRLGIDTESMMEVQSGIDSFAEQLRSQLKPLEIKPAIDTKVFRMTSEEATKAASAIGSIGSALQSIEDPGAKVAGLIATAIGNIALTFASSLKGTVGPWDWIAAAAAGTATLLTTIASIKSATAGHFAEGGMVKGNSYSNDQIPIMANAGEIVLNRAQASSIAGQLQGNGGGNMSPSWISGEQIYVAMNRYTRRTGRGEIVTWK